MTSAGIGRPFVKFWIAATTSSFGTAVTDVAVPLLAVLTFHASALQVAALVAIEQVSWLLIGLPAGVWVDRWSRRAVLVLCDLGRAALIISIPVAAVLGVLTLTQLFIVAALAGLLSVFFEIAQMSVVPTLVSTDQLANANGKLSATVTGADLAGAGAAGLLVQLLGAPLALLTDGVSFLVSGMLLRDIPKRPAEHEPAARRRFAHDLTEGLRITFKDPFFRTTTLSTAVSNFCAAGQHALMVVFLVNTLHTPTAVVGVLAGVGGVGGIAGASMAGKLAERYSSGTVWRAALLLAPLFTLLIPTSTHGWGLTPLIVGGIGQSASLAVANILSGSARQALCPASVIGRLSASSRVITWGVIPIGALTMGALATATTIRDTLWVVAIGFVAPPLIIRLSALWKVRDLQTATTTLS
jgi:predicted MFS family arabinose efflux permease